MRTGWRGALGTTVLLATLVAAADAQDAPRLVGPFTKEDYPQAVIDRPLTLPAGMVEGEIGGRFVSVRPDFQTFGVGGTDDWNLDLALRVGVTDRIQLEASTEFQLDHTTRNGGEFEGGTRVDLRPTLTSWQRMIPVRLSVLALDTESLDTAVTLTLPFVAYAQRTVRFFRGGQFIVRNSDGRALPLVELAAPTRWRLTDWLWLRAGQNLLDVTTGDGFTRLAFDFGIGVQPHPMFALTLDSRIAAITFYGEGRTASQTLADVGTLALEGTFAPIRGLDIVGDFDIPDVGNGVNSYEVRTAVRVRF